MFKFTRRIVLENNLRIIFETRDLYSEAGLEVKDNSSPGSINEFLHENARVLSIKHIMNTCSFKRSWIFMSSAFILEKDIEISNGPEER